MWRVFLQDDIFVGRAPGRLDVMGGIADYSGSLVLQLPLAEACHVAVQRHPLAVQPLWRHMHARHVRAPSRKPIPQNMLLHRGAACSSMRRATTLLTHCMWAPGGAQRLSVLIFIHRLGPATGFAAGLHEWAAAQQQALLKVPGPRPEDSDMGAR